jgi:hypothetical protein
VKKGFINKNYNNYKLLGSILNETTCSLCEKTKSEKESEN